jgi:ketosteroid isomerase-like protein
MGVERAANERLSWSTGTNKSFEVRGAIVVEFANGKITRNSDYWDLATYKKQVGLTK